MKKVLAAIAAVLSVSAAHATDDRFWDYYTPVPSNFIGSDEWWRGDAATGDWWGTRNWLDKSKGIEFSGTYTTDLAGNPVGGMKQGFTYTDNIAFGAKLDLETLVGWRGGSFTIAAARPSYPPTSSFHRNFGREKPIRKSDASPRAMTSPAGRFTGST